MERAYQISEHEKDVEALKLADRIYLVLQDYDFDGQKAWIYVNSTARGLFSALDSKFFQPAFKEGRVIFRSRPMLGREFNYFFQGFIFRLFGRDRTQMYSTMTAWKASYILSSEFAIHIVSPNDRMMADAGFDEAIPLWRKAVRDTEAYMQRAGKRNTMYKPYKPNAILGDGYWEHIATEQAKDRRTMEQFNASQPYGSNRMP